MQLHKSVSLSICYFYCNFQLIVSFDLNYDCKINEVGHEFLGILSQSMQHKHCDFWSKSEGAKKMNDLLFPDGSKLKARNYCRNPTRSQSGPWCYVEGIHETCNVPLCSIQGCRMTGPGMEYNGTLKQSAWYHSCMPWSGTNIVGTDSYWHEMGKNFNKSISNTCRNPDNSVYGPWCMVKNEKGGLVKELCDVPFCNNDPVFLIRSTNSSFRQFLWIKVSSFTASLRLWNSDDWLEGIIGIILSVTDQITFVQDIGSWGSAVIITISNTGSKLLGPKVMDKTESPGVVSAVRPTNVTITWSRNEEGDLMAVFVSLNGSGMYDMSIEFETTGYLLQDYDFRHVGFTGVPVFVGMQQLTEECTILTTAGGSTVIWMQIERGDRRIDFNGSFRFCGRASLVFATTPLNGDQIIVTFLLNGSMEATCNGARLKTESENISDPWKIWDWHYFRVSMWDSNLVVYINEPRKERIGLSIKNLSEAGGVMWVAPLSDNVTHWKINCNEINKELKTKHNLPNCLTSTRGLNYNGTFNIAGGNYCLPWIDKRIPLQYRKEVSFKKFGSITQVKNYCRNFDSSKEGPFCFIALKKAVAVKQTCIIPRCSMTECKIVGIGTDFSGELRLTKSNRSCKGVNQKSPCFNPSRSVGGPWCETTDPVISKDYCDVRDCERPDESIFLVTRARAKRAFYILPSWKKNGVHFWIKNWDPEKEGSLIITIWSMKFSSHYKIILGGGEKEEANLLFVSGDSERILDKKLTPHLVPSGLWRGLWLKVESGIVKVGHVGIHFGFLEWENTATEDDSGFEPMFIDFSTESESWIGISFPLSECLIERVLGNTDHRLWSVNAWREASAPTPLVKIFNFNFNSNGLVTVKFFGDPDSYSFFVLTIDGNGVCTFSHKKSEKTDLLQTASIKEYSTLSKNWTNLTARYTESSFIVEVAGIVIIEYLSNALPLLFYWFSVESEDLSWSANCNPLDYGDKPRDGHWSPWSDWLCSKPCDGGEGKIFRTCDNPRPNLLGKECPGSQTFSGACNVFECGDMPPDLRKKIRQSLSYKNNSVVADFGSDVQLRCDEYLISLVQDALLNVSFVWTFNGFALTSNFDSSNFSLRLSSVSFDDSGVYICSVKWKEDEMAITVSSLIVTSLKETVVTRETLPLILKCHGATLGNVYADLSQKWTLNGMTWKNYGPTSLDKVDLESVPSATKHHMGDWVCVISQEDLGLSWKTNWMRVLVKPAPSFWTHLIEDKATAMFFNFVDETYVPSYFYTVLAVLLILITGTSIACYFV